MSTPIQQDGLNPDDPKYYAPPKWRNGEIDAPPIRSSLRPTELPNPRASADWSSRYENNVVVADPCPKSRDHSGRGLRMTALASAVGGAVAWIAFCIMAGLARLGTADLANAHISANDPEYSLSGRLQEASATLHQASRQVFVPTFVVADASGLVNAALPLAITVTNYTSDTNIHLSGLVVGTTLSSGATAGDGQWRVAIDDLPKTRVIPPPEYVGEMTILAELRGGDDQGIVRTPVRLTWRPAAADSTEAMEPHRSVPLPSVADNVEPKQVLFEQFLAWQNEPTVAQPRQLKPGKNMSGTIKASKFKKQNLAKRQRHRIMSVRSELQTNIDPRQELRPPPTYNSFANVYAPRESNPLWNDDSQTTFDANWRRCGRLFGC